jgi:hypothetical protein
VACLRLSPCWSAVVVKCLLTTNLRSIAAVAAATVAAAADQFEDEFHQWCSGD